MDRRELLKSSLLGCGVAIASGAMGSQFSRAVFADDTASTAPDWSSNGYWKGEKPLRVSQAPSWQANGHERDVLVEGQFMRTKSKGECPNTKPAVLIDGKGAGHHLPYLWVDFWFD